MAASTIGTFLRTFTFGHVRQLDAVLLASAATSMGDRCRTRRDTRS